MDDMDIDVDHHLVAGKDGQRERVMCPLNEQFTRNYLSGFQLGGQRRCSD